MEFPKETSKYDAVWFGEIHGIKENYEIYKNLLPQLSGLGFKTVLWEMAEGFSTESKHSEDGRINPFSIDLLRWIQSQIKNGTLEDLLFFGRRKPIKNGTVINYEPTMAKELLDILHSHPNKKFIIISGNYHMQRAADINGKTQRCIDYIESESKLRILTIKLKYLGGTLYNFGIKRIPKPAKQLLDHEVGFINSEKNNRGLTLQVGEAHAVFKKPTDS